MQGLFVPRRRSSQGGFGIEAGHRRQRSAARAFTLVELLIVIGILVILVGILLPVLRNAQRQSESIRCMANLRSIGQAVLVYTQTNGGYFAPARNYSLWEDPSAPTRQVNPNHANAYWGVFYAVAAKLPRETFSCPTITQKERATGSGGPEGYANMWCTYGLNAWGNEPSGMNDAERTRFFGSTTHIALFKKGGGWSNATPPRIQSAVRYPDKTLVCQDAWEPQLDGGRNGDTYASVDAGNRGRLTEYPGHDIEYLRHGGFRVSNALFVDGHVEALTKAQQTDERYYTGRWDFPRSYP
jgi:prepilin-type processing-associated H-X9-DG protein